ncbi:MAG: hypothetical protein R2684_09825 [Pyrinomonadaceae bacterium]
MSTNLKFLFLIIALVAVFPRAVIGSEGEINRFSIEIDESNSVFKFEAAFGVKRGDEISFVDSIADSVSLVQRIRDFTFTKNGKPIITNRFGSGYFSTPEVYDGFRYEIRSPSPEPLIAAPHISWITHSVLLVRTRDLFPNGFRGETSIEFKSPKGWKVFGPGKWNGDFVRIIPDPRNAAFFVWKDGGRIYAEKAKPFLIRSLVLGDWEFEDSEVSKQSREIAESYGKLFGASPTNEVFLSLMPFPGEIDSDRWRAETDRDSVVVFSAKTSVKSLAKQRLHEQLRHEFFHLWIPNGVRLEGDYAWFYEGFARYQSLRLAVSLGRITFSDYLRAVAESVRIGGIGTGGGSLADSSLAIWNGNPGRVTARGMSIAFLIDSRLTAGKEGNSGKFISKFYNRYRNAEFGIGAMDAVLSEMRRYESIKSLVEQSVLADKPIDWESELKPFGIVVEARRTGFELAAVPNPTRSQRALIDKLGYNDWKKYRPK